MDRVLSLVAGASVRAGEVPVCSLSDVRRKPTVRSALLYMGHTSRGTIGVYAAGSAQFSRPRGCAFTLGVSVR
jgi:hypothetical protein